MLDDRDNAAIREPDGVSGAVRRLHGATSRCAGASADDAADRGPNCVPGAAAKRAAGCGTQHHACNGARTWVLARLAGGDGGKQETGLTRNRGSLHASLQQ
jgi:hypothetical protein